MKKNNFIIALMLCAFLVLAGCYSKTVFKKNLMPDLKEPYIPVNIIDGQDNGTTPQLPTSSPIPTPEPTHNITPEPTPTPLPSQSSLPQNFTCSLKEIVITPVQISDKIYFSDTDFVLFNKSQDEAVLAKLSFGLSTLENNIQMVDIYTSSKYQSQGFFDGQQFSLKKGNNIVFSTDGYDGFTFTLNQNEELPLYLSLSLQNFYFSLDLAIKGNAGQTFYNTISLNKNQLNFKIQNLCAYSMENLLSGGIAFDLELVFEIVT